MAGVGSSRNGCAMIGIPHPSLRKMPTDCAQYATAGAVEAKSEQNLLNLENLFLH
jgi:hypothetical protein